MQRASKSGILLAAAVALGGAALGRAEVDGPWIVLNEDRDQFVSQHLAKHPDEPITREVVRAWADRWFARPLTHCFVNPNCMTVLWDSKVLDRQFDVHRARNCQMEKYLPGHNRLIAACEDMCRRGVDPHAIFIEEARRRGIEPWLSMRMNDCHFTSDTNGCYTTGFWKEHPECWRMPNFFTSTRRSNFLLAFDYAQAAVRELHLKALAEMLERYDVDGVELDWMRHHFHFALGRERADAHFLTEFMREAKRLIEAAGAKKGRRLPIAVRVTTRPEAALALGTDPFEWAREDLVDVLIVGCYFDSNDMQVPIAEWKRRLAAANPRVKFLLGCEPRIAPEATDIYNCRPMTESEWNGWVERGFDQGVDGFYFFNHYCIPRTSGFGKRFYKGEPWTRETFKSLPRAYPVSFCDAVSEGEPETAGRQLPAKLDVPRQLVINIGEKPTAGVSDVVLVSDRPLEASVLGSLTVNGVRPTGVEEVNAGIYMRIRRGVSRTAVRATLPADTLRRGDNVVSLSGGSAATLMFCEIETDPDPVRSRESYLKPIRLVAPAPGTLVELPPACAFGSNETFYVRAKTRLPTKFDKYGACGAVILRYAEHGFAAQLFFTKDGKAHFALRAADGGYCPIASRRAPKDDALVEVTGIRHRGKMYLSLDGEAPDAVALDRGTLSLMSPVNLEVEPNMHGVQGDFAVESVEVGRGWPADVPCAPNDVK